MKAGIVGKMEDWPYSSFREYLIGGGLCNQKLAKEILEIQFSDFYEESYLVREDTYTFNV
jgi:hypothetical protein